jgi:predicted dehydrogenase
MTRQHMVILGCGKIARLHAKLIGRYRDHIDLSFASRSPDRAEQYRRKFRGRAAFASYGEACEDPTVDVVVDCTPPSQHAANAERAALHRKTLIVEKPLARNLEELDRIAKIAADAGVLAMVAENYRFKPLLTALRHHIERGDIGTPLFYDISRAGRSVKTGWRADPEEMGGGALLEGGVHWVNLLLELGGSPQTAVAMRPTLDYPMASPFEDCLELLVRFRAGTVGRLFHSWNTTSRVAGLGLSRILGTEGNIHFESNGLFASTVSGLPRPHGLRGHVAPLHRGARWGRPATHRAPRDPAGPGRRGGGVSVVGEWDDRSGGRLAGAGGTAGADGADRPCCPLAPPAPPTPTRYSSFTSAISFLNESFASPKSIDVFSS